MTQGQSASYGEEFAGLRVGTTQFVDASPPVAPSELVVTAVTASSVSLSWTDNSDNETAFRIERSEEGGGFASLTSTGAGVTSCVDTGLKPCVSLSYRVRAMNPAGNSATSNEVSTVTGPTIDMTVRKGALSDSPLRGKDKLSVTASFRFNDESADGRLDPAVDTFQILVGGADGPLQMLIGATHPGWKIRGDKMQWTSSRGLPPKVSLKLDLDKGTLTLKASGFDFPLPQANPIRVSMRAGPDGAFDRRDWSSKKAGQFKFP